MPGNTSAIPATGDAVAMASRVLLSMRSRPSAAMCGMRHAQAATSDARYYLLAMAIAGRTGPANGLPREAMHGEAVMRLHFNRLFRLRTRKNTIFIKEPAWVPCFST